MEELLPMMQKAAPILALTMVRLSAFLLLVPVLSDPGPPRQARLALLLVLGGVVFAIRGFGMRDPVPDSFILGAMSEMATGLWMGFILRTLFEVVALIGHIMGFEMGLGFTAAVDPINGQQSIVITTLYRYTTALLFLSSGALHSILLSLVSSYDIVEMGSLGFERFTELAWQAVELFRVTLHIGLALVAPMLIVSFCLSIGIALLARMVQGFQVLELGFPMRILVGFLVVWLSLPHLLPALNALFEQMNTRLIEGLQGS
ncbi:MAG: flagellar biosynthetic protein FliR [Planctomycetota bacterium]